MDKVARTKSIKPEAKEKLMLKDMESGDTSDTDTFQYKSFKIHNSQKDAKSKEPSNIISQLTPNLSSETVSKPTSIVRRDVSGRLIEKINKKNYHISFRDRISKSGLVDFINIPNKNNQEIQENENTMEKDAQDISNDQQSCACIIY